MSDEEDKSSSGPGPWTIRDVPHDIRSIALKLAKKEKMTTAQWLERTIREKVKSDRQKGTALATTTKPVINLTSANTVLDMLERLHRMGVEMPESMKKQALTLIRACMNDVKQGKDNVLPAQKEVIQEPSEGPTE